MVKKNIAIAIIIIVLFIILAIVGFAIYGIKNQFAMFDRSRRAIDEEEYYKEFLGVFETGGGRYEEYIYDLIDEGHDAALEIENDG
ncbi:predicted protein [Uncinocarpus reesii 1704]|uniref:Uncharacterized protein n=1 Tax=Uncinocarpus reesii (strain UAMH 1704) TaxID=336963 RepID=C4JG13_UNCRE|nr:uncharacterized protein UREG_01093 [Uncinocarpus reesii 1704]EEP76244.1 predicted protein [Uncinocarpus reesii 1704]